MKSTLIVGDRQASRKSTALLLAVGFMTLTASTGTMEAAGPQPTGKLTVCNFSNVGKEVTLPLSSLVSNCSLVRLENSDDALFKTWYTTVTNNYIGIRQSGSQPYKLFDRSGKFLGNVGAVGNGPGEYAIAVYDDLIDDVNERVYLAPITGSSILVYDTKGKFLKKIEAPNGLHKPRLHLSANGLLSVIHMPFEGDKAMVMQFDTNGKLIKQLPPRKDLLVRNFDGELFNTRNTQAFEMQHTSCDTLFHYDVKTNALRPVFTMKVKEEMTNFKQYIELPRHYATYIFGKGRVLTDKKSGNSTYFNVVNDFYGNLSTPFSIMHFRNGYYVCNLEPGQLITTIENRLKESNCTAKDKQTLTKLLGTLDENSNNLVFIGKLK